MSDGILNSDCAQVIWLPSFLLPGLFQEPQWAGHPPENMFPVWPHVDGISHKPPHIRVWVSGKVLFLSVFVKLVDHW